ncbi:hypothetical protein EI982_15930 [Haloplanus rallus]|jgi:hypothetical protein|uniref:Uncharacterized protein n=1 Tax=Haloplanus rallus TaxID=1816183 RepID=A0A6B9F6X5_9EURY|nr:hypothetical protein [Haloplanus rallus]QGX96158.1 hypothetical protein EI982_15930 [Haloplanus rallus]
MRRPEFRRTDDAEASTGRLAGLRRRLARIFALRPFLLAVVLSLVGLVAGGSVPLIGSVGRFLGIALAGFVLAFVVSDHRYVEAGLAGALTAGIGFVVSAFDTALLPVVADYGLQVAGVGTTAGLIAALLGHYFGRDLRAGLTREL